MTRKGLDSDVFFRHAIRDPRKVDHFKWVFDGIVQEIQQLMGVTGEQTEQYTKAAMNFLQAHYWFGDDFSELFSPDISDYVSRTEKLLQSIEYCREMAGKVEETSVLQQLVDKNLTEDMWNKELASDIIFNGTKILTVGISSILADRNYSGEPNSIIDLAKDLVVKFGEAAKQNVNGLKQYIEDLDELVIPIDNKFQALINELPLENREDNKTIKAQFGGLDYDVTRKANKAIKTGLEGLEQYIKIAKADMLPLIDASDGTSRYNTICEIKDGLELLVAQGIDINTVRTLIGNDVQQQPEIFELLIKNPKYVNGFDILKRASVDVSAENYTKFLQKRADKNIGDSTETAFIYVGDIVASGNNAVAKQLMETGIDWTTFSNLDEFYKLAVKKQISKPIAESYLNYGAKKELNKQRIILDVAGLHAFEEEVKKILNYMDSMHDNELGTISSQNYEEASSLMRVLEDIEGEQWLGKHCEQHGEKVRTAYDALEIFGHGYKFREIVTNNPGQIHRLASKVVDCAESRHSSYLSLFFGEPKLISAIPIWLSRKPVESISEVIGTIPVAPLDSGVYKQFVGEVHAKLRGSNMIPLITNPQPIRS